VLVRVSYQYSPRFPLRREDNPFLGGREVSHQTGPVAVVVCVLVPLVVNQSSEVKFTAGLLHCKQIIEMLGEVNPTSCWKGSEE